MTWIYIQSNPEHEVLPGTLSDRKQTIVACDSKWWIVFAGATALDVICLWVM